MADSFVRNIVQQWKLDKYIPAFEGWICMVFHFHVFLFTVTLYWL